MQAVEGFVIEAFLLAFLQWISSIAFRDHVMRLP